MRSTGALDVVTAAYRLELDEEGWLTALAEAARAGLDAGLGVGAWVCIPRPESCAVRTLVNVPEDPALRAAALAAVSGVPPALNAAIHRTLQVTTASEEAALRGLPSEVFDYFQAPLLELGIADTANIQAADLSGVTALITVSLPRRSTMHPRVRHVWRRVAVHLAAGLRLRQALEAPASLDGGEAVLDAGGRVVHAEGVARGRSARDRLRQAALAVDRARLQRTASEPDEALELWHGLVAGRWSVVERFDTDARRYFVAYHNEPATAGDRALTRRELQVAALAAIGHGDDDLAYALGLRASTVRTHLTRALGKLGLRSRAALVELTAMIGLAPEPPLPDLSALARSFRPASDD